MLASLVVCMHCDIRAQHASRAMGYGAIKYADLKSNRTTNYRFSYDDMLSMQVVEHSEYMNTVNT